MSKNNKGFTLVELVIVLIIVAVLSAIAILTYSYFIDKARLISSVATLNAVKSEIEVYSIDKKAYPASINFINFTDQDNNQILSNLDINQVRSKIYSLETSVYNVSANFDSYFIKAKAVDSNHTILTLSRNGITY